MINARLETAETKPTHRKPLASRRCLLPAEGYYEWKKTPARKQPPASAEQFPHLTRATGDHATGLFVSRWLGVSVTGQGGGAQES